MHHAKDLQLSWCMSKLIEPHEHIRTQCMIGLIHNITSSMDVSLADWYANMIRSPSSMSESWSLIDRRSPVYDSISKLAILLVQSAKYAHDRRITTATIDILTCSRLHMHTAEQRAIENIDLFSWSCLRMHVQHCKKLPGFLLTCDESNAQLDHTLHHARRES